MVRFGLIFGLAWAHSAFAETAPSFDCAAAQSDVEVLICGDDTLARLDRGVAARYDAALNAAAAMEAGAQESVANLRATQRGWIKGRDECWKAEDSTACVTETMQRREAELVALWMLEAPSGQTAWACNDSPANAVVTVFFDTELPSVRFERGDTIDVGVRSPTASGARYDGSFGRSIWIQGDEATYRAPDPDGTEMTCIAQPDG